jgi:hypothetical protein
MKDMAQLEALYERREAARIEHDAAINEIIPADIRSKVEELNANYDSMMDDINEAIKFAEEQVKAAVIEIGETIRGTRYQAIWSKPRVSWDDKRLEEYFNANEPEAIDRMRKMGKPNVSIRKISNLDEQH